MTPAFLSGQNKNHNYQKPYLTERIPVGPNQKERLMAFKRINELFPLQKLLYLLLAIAIGVQLIVISFNHYTGFYVLDGFGHFLWRFARGVALSLLAGFIMAIPGLLIIRFLNQTFPWKERAPQRLLVQLGLTILVALAVSTLTTLALHTLRPYESPLPTVLVYNALIFSVVNIILTAILEGMLFFSKGDAAEQKAKALEKELSQIRFEVLKSQINPHFMFNSLNVLSGLIDKDVNKAQQFIDEFSLIYRYVLETIEKPVVTLNDELQFVRSYVFLQQMRYGEALEVEVNLPAHLLSSLLPPLSLQVVFENAIKHNVVSPSSPLRIEVFAEDEWLVVKNNIQPKVSSGASTRLGQDNMVKRYKMVCSRTPQFMVDMHHYTARLPLIETIQDESDHH